MPTSFPAHFPDFDYVQSAAKNLKNIAVRTPLMENSFLNGICGGRLLIKAEPLQKTGSFKFRGAYNKISRIPESEKNRGVVAYSSGNHAQGVAAAAQMLGLQATIIMPQDAPKMKIENTLSYGAEVITYDRFNEDRQAIGNRVCEEKEAIFVSPFDDPMIIAGQGTVGLEIAEQTVNLGAKLDAVLINCGGGGLISGCAIALSEKCPDTPIYAVEPREFDDTARSLKSGKIEKNDPQSSSICDALLSPQPGDITFPINHKLLSGGLVVSDEDVRYAMQQAFARLKLVVEPGGAVSLAAALTGTFDCRGKTVAVVCSGGNVDPEMFAKII